MNLKLVSYLNMIVPFSIIIFSLFFSHKHVEQLYHFWYFAIFMLTAIGIIVYTNRIKDQISNQDRLMIYIINSSYLILVLLFYTATWIFPVIQ